MSGGTSRRDHSEVGSSYIHFNFTPDGDKTTPSLFGDVVHGVLLDQPAVFPVSYTHLDVYKRQV